MFLLFTLHVSLFTPSQAWACSTCIGWSKDGSLFDAGFALSGLLITLTPVGLAASIGGWLFYQHKRSKREADEQRSAVEVNR